MKRFRIITSVSLTIIFVMITGNVFYLCGLYESIKQQSVQMVEECARRAFVIETINRLKGSMIHGTDESFLKLTLLVEGVKNESGEYEYPNIVDDPGNMMSAYFNYVAMSDSTVPPVDMDRLNMIFAKKLNDVGLYPAETDVEPHGREPKLKGTIWSVDIQGNGQIPVYTAYFSSLNGHIIRQMSGIIVTSASILILTGFMIVYLLRWVGRLRTIEQMKDDFTHNMTHELKTPVAVAYSAADSMLRYYDQSDEERNKKYLKIILQRLSFLSGMIENILSMSMERFKSIKLNIEEIDIKHVVEEVAGLIELKADKPVTISVDVAEDLHIQADALHFGNVISNLLDNAVKYSEDSVEIRVRGDRDKLIVSDNGIGIKNDFLPLIFDKFYRVTYGARYETGGYGLGLYYVKRIVELHGWNIAVESAVNEGTTFTIIFNDNEKR